MLLKLLILLSLIIIQNDCILAERLKHLKAVNDKRYPPFRHDRFNHQANIDDFQKAFSRNKTAIGYNFVASNRNKRSHGNDKKTERHLPQECPMPCRVKMHNLHAVRRQFQDTLEETKSAIVTFDIHFTDSNQSLLELYPYMGDNFRASQWVWANGKLGKRLLGLPLDADVLSLYILPLNTPNFDLRVYSKPDRCFVKLSPSCRLKAVQDLLIRNVTHITRRSDERHYVCHKVVKEISNAQPTYTLLFKCCDTAVYIHSSNDCHFYSESSREISGTLLFINLLAGLVTLFSPVCMMQIKLALSYDNTTKFFRASLKHGITGQRNYVIRISSRQLINLNDNKPFSIPRFLFRLFFHCYGEGRCLIHWWSDWEAQPEMCKKKSLCKKIYMSFWRIFAVLVLYPIVFYIALALYLSKLTFCKSVLELVHRYKSHSQLDLDMNIMALVLMPQYNPWITVWIIFSFCAFLYSVFLISWPTNTLENCLLGYEGKRASQQPRVFYKSLTRNYKNMLHQLAYGDFTTKRHFFRINWVPWGIRRTFLFVGRLLMQIPIIYVAFTLLRFDTRFFGLRKKSRDVDETEESLGCIKPRCPQFCKWILTIIVWVGFLVMLSGYCSAIYIVVQFIFNVLFFTFLAIVLNSNMMLPWTCFVVVVLFYINDTLSQVNKEHGEILRLIDENSPRISAVEDSENVLRDAGTQILKVHNLGAVKFIDGDNTEYVSKELYYSVCRDLKCGWSVCIRRILYRSCAYSLYAFIVFLCLSNLAALFGSNLVNTILAIAISLLPKFTEHISKQNHVARALIWAKVIPGILDRHIRVDRTRCLDDAEVSLSTYDVRPVGMLEMDIPKMVAYGNLRMWKFPWVVSADQQTHSPETFIIALASKLAAANFVSKIVTRLYSPDLADEHILRHWCLLVENSIIDGSSTANSINGVPLESVRLFPREVQSLVSHFRTGNTIDNVVDNINRELYGPYTKGVLVTIGNTPLAIGKLDNTLFAFNAGCHGEQVTDLFGAILITAEFNTQNLQTIVKFIMDPYSPDAVPVYAIIPMEGFIFQSPEILELESPSPT